MPKEKIVTPTLDQVKTVSVSMSQKVVTRQYETRDLFVGCTMEVLVGQDPKEVVEVGEKMVKEKIKNYYNQTIEAVKMNQQKGNI